MRAPFSSRYLAAVVQAAPVIFDREATLAKVRVLTERAAGAGARLVVFPEAFVGGARRELSSRHGGRSADGDAAGFSAGCGRRDADSGSGD